jgi:hypothetical protein
MTIARVVQLLEAQVLTTLNITIAMEKQCA